MYAGLNVSGTRPDDRERLKSSVIKEAIVLRMAFSIVRSATGPINRNCLVGHEQRSLLRQHLLAGTPGKAQRVTSTGMTAAERTPTTLNLVFKETMKLIIAKWDTSPTNQRVTVDFSASTFVRQHVSRFSCWWTGNSP